MIGANEKMIEIPVMGHKVVLKTRGDAGFADEVTEMVLARLAASEQRVRNSNAPHLAAVLALFDLGEDYLAAKRKLAEHRAELLGRVEGLEARIAGEEPGRGGETPA